MNTLVIAKKGQQIVEAAHGQIIKSNRPCVLHSMTDFLSAKIGSGVLKILGEVPDSVTDSDAKKVWIGCGRDTDLAVQVLLGKAKMPEPKPKADAKAPVPDAEIEQAWKEVELARAELEKAKADLEIAKADAEIAKADAEKAKAEAEKIIAAASAPKDKK